MTPTLTYSCFMSSRPRPHTAVAGTGLFSGRAAVVRIEPSGEPTGIRFHVGGVVVPATIEHVTSDASWSGLPAGFPIRNTTLRGGGVFVATTEHLLSALAGCDVWHADVHLDGIEVPILDGCAFPFVEAMRQEQRRVCAAPAPIALSRRVHVEDVRNGASITAVPLAPGEQPSYTYHFDYGGASSIPAHSASWDLSSGAYVRDIAPARTFSFVHEVEAARKAGLFAHLSPRDMLVVGPDGQPIDNAWRFPDGACITTEPARHKLLDLIGDLALLGRPLHARVTASRSGHALTHQFCRAVRETLAIETLPPVGA